MTHEFTVENILRNSTRPTLKALFAHLAQQLIIEAGEASDLTEIPIRDQQTGELICWLRSFRADVAAIESNKSLRESLRQSLESESHPVRSSTTINLQPIRHEKRI